jgi:hypothetical protein
VALGEVATRDYIRSELRDLLDDLPERESKSRKKKKRPIYDDSEASVTDSGEETPLPVAD